MKYGAKAEMLECRADYGVRWEYILLKNSFMRSYILAISSVSM